MFKKIKKYLSFRRRCQHEVLETLATICLYLDYEGRRMHNFEGIHMRGHFQELKALAEELRKETPTP